MPCFQTETLFADECKFWGIKNKIVIVQDSESLFE